MIVALTGATGFTGSHTLPRLLAAGHEVRCLVRRSEDFERVRRAGAMVVQGDLADSSTVARCFEGCDALLNIASLGFGHAETIVRAAEYSGIGRAVFVSTTSVFTKLNARSKSVRLAAEKAVQQSGLAWTIVRPTMIYGTSRDRNICKLIRYLRKSPLLPVFGSGEALVQPIHVGDLADLLVRALTEKCAERRAYNVSGAKPLSYNELVRTVAGLLGRRVLMVHLPASPIVGILQVTEKIGVRMPIKAEQILRLQEDKTFNWDDARRDIGFCPRTFREGVESEIESMGFITK